VGILGKGNVRSDGKTNAAIGLKHEFGDPTTGLPQRSWLRIPLTDELGKEVKRSGVFDKDSLREVVKTGMLTPWVKRLGLVAYRIVLEGFHSNGYGKWAPWRKGYTSQTGEILVDTQQLRDSVTWELKE
jgi:hypothetical protein